MNRKFSVIFILTFAVLIFGISASATDPWFMYNPEASPNLIVSMYKARINEDYSVTVVIKVKNAGQTLAENFSISEATVKFGKYSFHLNDQIKGKNIKANSTKKYSIKIPNKGVPEDLNDDDLKKCEYSFKYSYALGEYWHTGSDNFVVEYYAYI